MIPKIKNILYATDLSENSAYALRYALNSAEHHDADLHILHVLEIRLLPVSPPAEDGIETLLEGPFFVAQLEELDSEQKRLAKEKIQKRLAQFCQQELKSKPEWMKRVASIQVVEGDPAGIILKTAEESNADLVILGTHSRGTLAHAFLGSVAESVSNRIKSPVLIIPLPEKTDLRFIDVQKR